MNEQLPLLAEPATKVGRKAPDLLEMQAREKLKMPAEWEVFLRECLPEDGPTQVFKLEGSIPGIRTRGPRKGQPDYRGGQKLATAYITVAEDRAWCKAWHIANNACEKCHGEGVMWMGWSEDDGHKYKPCFACNSTGTYQGVRRP